MKREIGSLGWFRDRARRSIVKMERLPFSESQAWDFSDSACLWGPGSAQIYDEVQGRNQQYGQAVTTPEVNLIKTSAAGIVARLPHKLAYIDLGPGTEGKEELIISEMLSQGKDVVYVPVDVNRQMLTNAALRIRKNMGLTVVPLHSAFEDLEWNQLVATIPQLIRRTPFVSLGLTFTNYEATKCLDILRRISGSHGIAFITTQLRDGSDIATIQASYKSELAQRLFHNKLRLVDLGQNDVGDPIITDEVLVFYPIIRPSSVILGKGGVANDMLLTHRAHRYSLRNLTDILDTQFRQTQFLDNSHPPTFAAILLEADNST